jgi:YVTN family beta-propeller protein
MSRYSSGRVPANRWPLWGLVALAALAACGDDSPAGPGRDITPDSPLYSTAPSDGALAYVTNALSNNVSVIQTSDNTVVATVAVGDVPRGVAVTPDGAVVYVTNGGSDNVSVIRTSDNTVVATVAVGSEPVGVAVTPDGALVYVTNFSSNNVSVIQTSDNTVVATVAVGSLPEGVAVTPDGAFAYVTNFRSDNVSVIRTSDNTVVATVAVGSDPVGVAVAPTTEACTIETLRDHVEALVAAAKLSQAAGHALSVKLEAALRLLERGKTKAAGNVLGAFLNQVEALVRSRRLSDADAGPLRDQAACVRTQLQG